MNSNKRNLVYILSNGRSGSTLLDTLLGAHPDCFSMGEFQMLPSDLKENNQACACGKNVSDCEFWSKIYQQNKTTLTEGTIDKFRSGFRNSGKVIRFREILSTLFSCFLNHEQIQIYGKHNFEIFTTISGKECLRGTTHLIDASKDPYRLKWLCLSGYFNMYAIHIIKEPEAMVYSFSKGHNGVFKTMYYTFRMSLRWIIENLIILLIIRKHMPKAMTIKIKYEDLASNHIKEMEKLYHFLSLSYKDIPTIIPSSRNHALSGNAMRFKFKEVKLDKRWESKMGPANKLIVRILTTPFKFLYK